MAFDFFRNVFDHVQIGCSDWPESVRFYRTVTAPLGIPVVAETDEWVMFAHLAVRPDRPVTTNLHLSFMAPSREAVDEFHRAGVEAGFRDFAPGIYAAYLLDPDGNNVEAVHRAYMAPAS
jgi:catechol 2,3-dioxygenase-like lactoylglutathione lyase family enzyme